jgi:small conductance mechanosensitive channel
MYSLPTGVACTIAYHQETGKKKELHMEDVSTEQLTGYMDTAVEMGMVWGPKLLLAIIVLVVGLWIINRFVGVVAIGMESREAEPTLAKFLTSLISVTFKALLLISVASMVGIATTSFIAVLGAAGLAVGLALQGSLANFAGGVLVLMFRPYKVGDFISAQGESGTVAEIAIFNTVLKTPDNKATVTTLPKRKGCWNAWLERTPVSLANPLIRLCSPSLPTAQ